jgi:hypothetical protein
MPQRLEKMSSKERIIATIKHETTDHIPLCFEGIGHQSVAFIDHRYPDQFERVNFYLDMEIDTAIRFGPPLYSGSGFQTKEWKEHHSEEPYPLLMKEYITPKGNLKQIVRKHEYPSDSVGLFSDHNVPSSRSLKYLIEKEDDLEKLEYILRPPDDEDLRWYREQAKVAKKFCEEKQVLFAGYLQGIGDPLLWMSGIDTVVMSSVLNPDFLKHYIDIVSRWNTALLEIQIEAGIDLIIRRGWYESTDFWAPDLFREFLFKPLKQEIEIAHQAGVYFTYVMNSKAKPMLSIFRDLGFDVYSNIDPVTADMDLADLKREIGDIITLYGGVNNFLVVENGTVEEVRKAVIEAIEKLAPGGGFVLGVGDVLDFLFANPENTERNFYEMIKVWKEFRNLPL